MKKVVGILKSVDDCLYDKAIRLSLSEYILQKNNKATSIRTILTLVLCFFILRRFDLIDWAWWWILSPIWIVLSIIAINTAWVLVAIVASKMWSVIWALKWLLMQLLHKILSKICRRFPPEF